MEKTIQNRQDSTLEDLFLGELKELYGAERHQLLVLPLLKKAASSLRLKNVIANHIDDTREQMARLELIFEKLGHPAEARASEAILGLARAAEGVIDTTEKLTATRDAGIIVAMQKLEHYEITSYGSLAQHARTLEYDDIEEMIELSLFEEKEADDLLTCLAENYVNTQARRE